jgi:hypothetical protein
MLCTIDFSYLSVICILSEGGLEYLHRSPASRGRRRKENPMLGGYNWAALSLGNISTDI